MTTPLKILIAANQGLIDDALMESIQGMGQVLGPMAATAGEVLDLAEKTRPDLVLLDLALWSETDLLEAAFQLADRRPIPVILLAEAHDEGLWEKARLSDPAGYLVKPFNPGQVKAAIHTALHLAGVKSRFREDRLNLAVTLDSIADAVIATDPQGRVKMMNRKAQEFTGWSMEQAREKPLGRIFNIVDPKTGDRVENPVDLALRDKTSAALAGPAKLISRDGNGYHIADSASPIRDRDGNTTGAVLVFRDVTEEYRAREELKNSLAFLNSVIDQSPHATWIADSSGTLVGINRACCEMFGLTEERVVNKYNILKDEVVRGKGLTPLVRSVFEQGRSVDLEIEYDPQTLQALNLKGTGSRFFRVIIFPIFDTAGQLTNVVVQHIDITNEKNSEKEKKRLERQLHQAQKMEALGTLAGGIAHDFNNILAAMIGYAELTLEDAEAGKPDLGRIKEILNAAARGKDLVTQILTFSRKLEPELRPSDLNEVILETEKLLERTIPRMIEIELDLAPDLRPINADPGQLAQVLMNLATNAKDAMPGGGHLRIRTGNRELDDQACRNRLLETPGNYVLLTVSDTGQGMDEKTLERIFDPFFTSKKIGEGTGLGLATVFGIVKNHGGAITCASRMGQGATFQVFLPALEGPAADHPLSQIEEPDLALGNETVMVVDDEEALRTIAQQLLSRRGYQTLPASCGEEALSIYREMGDRIDLVLLDMSMPGMGGHKCLQQILEINPGARVVIFSGYARDGLIQESLNLGAVGFVAKPFSQGELLKTIRRALDNGASAPEQPPGKG